MPVIDKINVNGGQLAMFWLYRTHVKYHPIMIYPIGIQNFESLINDGYMYVDKTALVYQMATTGRYYFLSRPRRFGKSLLLSTLEAYLSGKMNEWS